LFFILLFEITSKISESQKKNRERRRREIKIKRKENGKKESVHFYASSSSYLSI